MHRTLFPSLALLVVFALATWASPPRARGEAGPDPLAGNPHASVRVIIYQDLECPDCAYWHGIFKSQIIPQFGQRVAFVFRDYPLPQHRWSFNAAVLARYFDTRSVALGMAWRDYCFTHQDDITPDNLLDKTAAWARPHGISRQQLEGVFSRTDLFQRVQHDVELGKKDNLRHTPTVLLAGVEASSPQQLIQMLQVALDRSAKR